MSLERDYYELLQVSRNASQEIIHVAFRRLAKDNHPDHGGDQQMMKLLNDAYSVLSNQEERRKYDQKLRDKERRTNSAPGGEGTNSAPSGEGTNSAPGGEGTNSPPGGESANSAHDEEGPGNPPGGVRKKKNISNIIFIFGLGFLSLLMVLGQLFSDLISCIIYGIPVLIFCTISPFITAFNTDGTLLTAKFKFGLFLMQIIVPMLGYLGFILYDSKQLTAGWSLLIIYAGGIFVWRIGKRLISRGDYGE